MADEDYHELTAAELANELEVATRRAMAIEGMPTAPNYPVIVRHLAVDGTHPAVAMCAPMLIPDFGVDAYPRVPIVLCTGCQNASMRRT